MRLLTSDFGTGMLLDGAHPALGPSALFQTQEAFKRSHSILGSTKFKACPGSSPNAKLPKEIYKNPDAKLPDEIYKSPDAKLSEEIYESPDAKLPEKSRSDLGGAELVTQSVRVVNHVTGEKTKYTYPECEKICTGQTRGYDTCANCSRRSGRAQETTRSDREVPSLTEANMKGTRPVDRIAVAKMDSPAETRRAGLD